MKNFAKASLFAAVMLAALSSASGAEALKDLCDDDAPSMEGGCDKATAPTPSKEGDAANKMPMTMKAHKPDMKAHKPDTATELLQELEGDMPANENRRRGVWGWVPFRSQLQKDMETVRKHFGEVEMTLTDRACVEVSMDGICVLSKCGPYKREWMNRFPWRWSKNNDYQLHVTDNGMEVRLGERRVWGVEVDETTGKVN